MKIAFVSGVLFASLIPAVAPTQFVSKLPAAAECENLLPHEPVLLYEVTGSTLAGPVDRTLTLYADGSMRLASASAVGSGQCSSGQVTPEAAAKLFVALAEAGAMGLCDDTQIVSDVPMHTLTLLRGAQDARAHTFSYWIGTEGYAAVDALLENFIAQQFPEF